MRTKILSLGNRFALLFIFVVYLIIVLRFFPASCLISKEPINYNDYMLHNYHWNTFGSYMDDAGKSWGYNPYWMSGYPDNTIYDVENKGVELLTYASNQMGLDDVIIFKWYLLFTFLVGPFLTYWAARNFGFSRNVSILILVLQIIFWSAIPYIRVMVVTGTYSYVFVSFLSIYILSLLYRVLNKQDKKALAGIFLLAPIAVMLHVYSALIICIPGLILYLLYVRKQPWYMHFILVCVAVFVLIVNSFWLIPLSRFLHYSTVSNDYVNQGSLFTFLMWSLMAIVLVPALLLTVFYTFSGLRRIRHEMGNKLYIFFGGTILFYLLLGAFGRYTPLTRMLVPLRYHVNMFQYMAFPGALGIYVSIRELRNRFKEKPRKGIVVRIGFGLSIIIPSILFVGISNAYAGNNPIAWFYSRDLCNHIYDQPQSEDFIEWLKNNTSAEGRILIESVWSPMEEEQDKWFYMNYEPVLPLLVNREFIGGPRDDAFFLHNHSGLHLDFVQFEQLADSENIPMILFKKPINSIELNELKEYFDLYNVQWIITSRPQAKEYFNQFPEYTVKVKEFGEVWIYRVEREPSFIVGGEGEVKATFNHIYVKNFSGGEIILKYHWMEGLATYPKLKLEEVKLMDDPVGFIKIYDAPSEFEIFLEY